jgi:dipeptidase
MCQRSLRRVRTEIGIIRFPKPKEGEIMKKKILYSGLSFIVAFALAFFALPVQNSYSDETELACSSLAAGRLATKDRSVLYGHNEDDGGNIVTRLHLVPRIKHEPGEVIEMWDIKLPDGTLATIPQVVGETWAYIWSEMPGFSFSDSYLNEWGVAIASDNCGPSRETNPERTPGIGYWLRRLVPERAKTAREGVQIMGAAVEEYGYNAPGRTYIVADPKEAWLFSAVYGKHWCAQRVPDRHVAFIPNYYTIREVKFGHPDFMYCKDLKSYAANQGWYTGGPFDFAKVYGGTAQGSFGNKIRHWGALRLLTGIEYPNMDDLPFSVEPNRKLTVKDIADVLRFHYEGTDYDQTKVGENGDPHHTSTRVICTASTQESFVMQLRKYLPSFVGNVYWRTQGRPCESVFVPIYLGILEIPTHYAVGERASYSKLPLEDRYYDPNSAYWVFNRMETLVDFDYLVKKPTVRSFWDDIEATEFELQDEIEMTALKIYLGLDFSRWGKGICDREKDFYWIFPRHRHEHNEYLARWFLTRYTESLALNAYYTALGFIEEFEP